MNLTGKDASHNGSETLKNDLFLWLKMHQTAGSVGLVSGVLLAAAVVLFFLSENEKNMLVTWGQAWAEHLLSRAGLANGTMNFIGEEGPYALTTGEVINRAHPFAIRILFNNLYLAVVSGLIGLFGGYYAWLKMAMNRASSQSQDQFIRGSEMSTAKDIMARLKAKNEKTRLPLGKGVEDGTALKLPVVGENKHMAIFGAPRSGKTQKMNAQIQQNRKDGVRNIINDKKMEYIKSFYRPGVDFIINLVDERCVSWNPFNEITSENPHARAREIEALVGALIPDDKTGGNKDEFFNNAASEILIFVLKLCDKWETRRNADIWELLTSGAENLATLAKDHEEGKRAFNFIERAGGQTQGVMSTAMVFAKCFELMQDEEGKTPFSINEWLEHKTADMDGDIFLVDHEDVSRTTTPFRSMVVDYAAKKILGGSIPQDERIYMFLDEFGSFQRLTTVTKLFTMGGSMRCTIVIGIQDVFQIESVYGRAGQKTILNSAAHKIVLLLNDPDTAEYISRSIGKAEVRKANENVSWGVADNRDGRSQSYSETSKELVMASEIQNLPERFGFAGVSGEGWCRVEVPIQFHIKETQEGFIERTDITVAELQGDEADAIADIKDAKAGMPSGGGVVKEAEKKTEEKQDKEREEDKEEREKEERRRQEEQELATLDSGIIEQEEDVSM